MIATLTMACIWKRYSGVCYILSDLNLITDPRSRNPPSLPWIRKHSLIQESCEASRRAVQDWSQHKPPGKLAHTQPPGRIGFGRSLDFLPFPPVIFPLNTQDGKTRGPHVYIFAYLLT